MFLEDGEWQSADEYCEKVLDLDPENARAYVGKLMAQLKVNRQDELKNCVKPFDDNRNYKWAIRFADNEFKAELAELKRLVFAKKAHETYISNNTISAGDGYIVGVKSDGTVVAVGDNDDGQCDVSDWTDIKVY